MHRKEFLKLLSLLPLSGTSMNLKTLHQYTDALPATEMMPALFIGHGSPTNAIEENEFVKGWQAIAGKLPVPKAIVCISAHWQTRGVKVTASPLLKTIHDFGGFQPEMYTLKYPSPGNPELADDVRKTIHLTQVQADHEWGLDHGTWVPLMKMYPQANIPVIQISLDYTQGAQFHYDLAKELAGLRKKGVLLIGSGNMVHNLGMIRFPGNSFDLNTEYGFDWTHEMNALFKQKILSHDHKALIDYRNLHKAATMAIPTTDHYFPLLGILGLQQKNDQLQFFNDKAIGGSLTMTSLLLQPA